MRKSVKVLVAVVALMLGIFVFVAAIKDSKDQANRELSGQSK